MTLPISHPRPLRLEIKYSVSPNAAHHTKLTPKQFPNAIASKCPRRTAPADGEPPQLVHLCGRDLAARTQHPYAPGSSGALRARSGLDARGTTAVCCRQVWYWKLQGHCGAGWERAKKRACATRGAISKARRTRRLMGPAPGRGSWRGLWHVQSGIERCEWYSARYFH